MRRAFCLLSVIGSLLLPAPAWADGEAIDLGRSSITVRVFKSGLFSVFADNHTIRAPLASGTVDESAAPSVVLTVNAGELKVLDPGLSVKDRSEVQRRMLGPDVLDVEHFSEIRFKSTAVEPAGAGGWVIEGNLTLHGETRPVKVSVAGKNGRYTGSAALRQRAFGIKPISLVGGTVNVKDEVRIEFEIVTVGAPSSMPPVFPGPR